jgi:hypothetical protein
MKVGHWVTVLVLVSLFFGWLAYAAPSPDDWPPRISLAPSADGTHWNLTEVDGRTIREFRWVRGKLRLYLQTSEGVYVPTDNPKEIIRHLEIALRR